MSQPLAIDLYCGLGGWAEGLLAEGWRVIGFDIERHDYGTGGYPGELVIRDVLTIHGSELKDADLIVASPPCQAYSYRAMPWKRARSLPPPDNSLFEACFRIRLEASIAAGRKIPLIIENVRGARKWVGWTKNHFGSYYLWGDVPETLPAADRVKIVRGHINRRNGHAHTRHLTNPAEHLCGVKGFNGEASGRGNLGKNSLARKFWSTSPRRKLASAVVAKIPFPLAQHIARVFTPSPHCTPNAPPR